MAKVVEETVTIKFSRLVRNDMEEEPGIVTEEHKRLIDATLQEVLELPAEIVVEVE